MIQVFIHNLDSIEMSYIHSTSKNQTCRVFLFPSKPLQYQSRLDKESKRELNLNFTIYKN